MMVSEYKNLPEKVAEISKNFLKNYPNFKHLVLRDYSIISVEILTGNRTGSIVLIVELFDNIFPANIVANVEF